MKKDGVGYVDMHTENLVNEAVVRQISVPDYSASPCTILDHILA